MQRGCEHRCGVCWESFAAHDGWFKHATKKHGADLALFGYDVCRLPLGGCPGEWRRFKNEGQPPKRKVKPPVLEVRAKDGTVYVQDALI